LLGIVLAPLGAAGSSGGRWLGRRPAASTADWLVTAQPVIGAL